MIGVECLRKKDSKRRLLIRAVLGGVQVKIAGRGISVAIRASKGP